MATGTTRARGSKKKEEAPAPPPASEKKAVAEPALEDTQEMDPVVEEDWTCVNCGGEGVYRTDGRAAEAVVYCEEDIPEQYMPLYLEELRAQPGVG